MNNLTEQELKEIEEVVLDAIKDKRGILLGKYEQVGLYYEINNKTKKITNEKINTTIALRKFNINFFVYGRDEKGWERIVIGDEKDFAKAKIDYLNMKKNELLKEVSFIDDLISREIDVLNKYYQN